MDDDKLNDDVQRDLEQQIEEATRGDLEDNPELKKRKIKKDEGIVPDIGTAKDQMNQEGGVEIL